MPVKTPIKRAPFASKPRPLAGGTPHSRTAPNSGTAPNSAPVNTTGTGARPAPKPDDAPILFQKYFKSANPKRTYAAQIKEARNGNQYLVLTEGKRDPDTDEVRKTRLFLYSEDFVSFFRTLQETALWIRGNPVPQAVKARREKFWTRRDNGRR